MKKILVIAIMFLLCFQSTNTQAQTIQGVTITSPILCFGDNADINIQVAQSNPPTVLKVVVGYTLFGQFAPITSTNNTTVTNINVPGLAAQTYTIRLVDSVSYYATNPNGSNPSSIYDFTTITVTQPVQLTSYTNQLSDLLCNDDCDATLLIGALGGTIPYSIGFNGGANATLSMSTFDSLYTNLCAGTYPISVTDANGCTVSSSSPTSAVRGCTIKRAFFPCSFWLS